MKKKILSSILQALLTLLFMGGLRAPDLSAAPGEPEKAIQIQGSEEILPGEVAVFIIQAPGRIEELSAELRTPGGDSVLDFVAFPLPGNADAWTALAGIPSTWKPGAYLFSIRARMENRGIQEEELQLAVLSRDFIYEDIPLNQAMSELRSQWDPRKTAEARELYRLLGQTDPGAIFHTDKFQHPVGDYPETSFFGDRRTFLYSDGGRARSIHYGIDYASPRGTPVRAAGAGRVVMARERIMTGHTVVLEHLPGVYSLYYHMDKILVEEGALVKVGEDIGLSGATGLVTGPHLHWEVRAAGNAVDPKMLLSEGILDKNTLFGMMKLD